MKLTGLNKAAGFALGILAVSALLGAQTPDRFFDTAPVKHEGVRLAVFYPSVGTIRNIEALRRTGALDVPGLVVVGVHHAREATDYAAARAYVREKGIDWFHFHTVSADIPEDALFGTNACTPEYERIFRASDGIIFFGGPDIPPAVFKEKTSPLTAIEDPVRHYFEVSAIFHLLGGLRTRRSKGFSKAGRTSLSWASVWAARASTSEREEPSSRTSGTRSTGRRTSRISSLSIPSNGTIIRISSSTPWTGSSATTSTGSGSRKRASSARPWASRAPTARGSSAPTIRPLKRWGRGGGRSLRPWTGRSSKPSSTRGSPTSWASSSTPSTGFFGRAIPSTARPPATPPSATRPSSKGRRRATISTGASGAGSAGCWSGRPARGRKGTSAGSPLDNTLLLL